MERFLALVATMLLACSFEPVQSEEPRTFAGNPGPVLQLCEVLLQANPVAEKAAAVAALFTKSMAEALPLESVQYILAALEAELGRCRSVTLEDKGGGQMTLRVLGQKNLAAECMVRLDVASNLIAGLQILSLGDLGVHIKSWSDAETALKGLDPNGQVSASFNIEGGGTKLALHSHRFQPIGSTFKLYVLGALEQAVSRGEHSWDDVLEIREELKSLPSGTLHLLPAGHKLTLRDLATKMISISDNTATDHLIDFLGRDAVEAMVLKMGNLNAAKNTPLLTTLEMFKLKWAVDPSVTSTFAGGDIKTKRAIVDLLKYVPRESVGTNGVAMDVPSYVHTIEWFATTNETCKAMFWLADRKDPEVRQILSHETPFVKEWRTSASPWSYVGYKGGSEAGVLNMTYLIEKQNGERSCFSVSWSNASRASPLFQLRLFDLVKKVLEFAQKSSS